MKFLTMLTLLCAVSAPGVEIDWVPVGDPGNPPDQTGYGAVAYDYQIGRFEVTVEQYVEFLNAVAADDPRQLWHPSMGLAEYRITEPVFAGRVPPRMPGCILRTGGPGAYRYEAVAGWEKKPVVYVSFLDGMRFANWLHNGRGKGDTETGAYDIAKHGGLAPHEPGARVWIATENEWVKAAYFQPPKKGGPEGGYWLYPTRSHQLPGLRDPGDPGVNVANFFNLRLPKSQLTDYAGIFPRLTNTSGRVIEPLFSDYTRIFPVGSFPKAASHYGTFDQGGNVSEWNEAVVYETQRRIRGGSVGDSFDVLQRVTRISSRPEKEYPDTGFRLARPVPTPATGRLGFTQPSSRP
jgi:sulfatase modifying factor 1